MSNQPNEAAQRYSPCREKSETLVGGVVTTMKPNDQGNWVRYSLLRKAEAEITSLRSALAGAERDCAGYKERIHELSDELGACEKERDEALAKLAEAEKRADSLQLETNCARNERDSAIDDWGALKSEREALAAQLAEARGALHKLANICALSGKAHGQKIAEDAIEYIKNGIGPFKCEGCGCQIAMGEASRWADDVFTCPKCSPPSDRGAEGEK